MNKIYLSKFDMNHPDFAKGIEMLSRIGVSVEIKSAASGEQYMEVCIDEETFNKSTKRNAGRPMVFVQENGHYTEKSVAEVRHMMKTFGPDQTAAYFGISRRTLYRKLQKAKKENNEYIY